MITIHHLENSRSQRIVWLAEELGITYKLEQYRRDPKTGLAPDSFKRIHPLGRAPIICADDLVLVESAAIIEFMIEQFDEQHLFSVPDNVKDQQAYRFWLHFAEGSLMPPVVAKLVMSKASQKVPFPFSFITSKFVDGVNEAYFSQNLADSLDYVEKHLANHHGFIGEQLTGVDFQMIFPLEAIVASGQADHYPAIKAYVKRIHQRAAYQKGLKTTLPYAYATPT
jgi:glutathione S-transferase